MKLLKSLPLALLFSFLTLSSGKTLAKNMDGRLGIGLEQTLSGTSGFAFRYFPHSSLAVTLTIGADLTIVDKKLSAGAAASAGAMFQLAQFDHANLSIGMRLAMAYRTLEAFQLINPDAIESEFHFAIEIPLGLEVWLADNLSIGAQTGILIDFVPNSGSQFHPPGRSQEVPGGGIGIGLGAGSLTGSLFMLYYF